MAHRSDRRGVSPITSLASKGRASDWHPARGFPCWPGADTGATEETEDTTAVRLFAQPSRYAEQPRRSARVKALRPPLAVRFAQP